jgi:hypothetical protein
MRRPAALGAGHTPRPHLFFRGQIIAGAPRTILSLVEVAVVRNVARRPRAYRLDGLIGEYPQARIR